MTVNLSALRSCLTKKKQSVKEDCVLEEGKGKMRLSTTLFSSLRLTGKKQQTDESYLQLLLKVQIHLKK